MNILVINQFGQNEIKQSEVIPRIGDKVDMFYEPLPSVTQVVMWPSKERCDSLGIEITLRIDAIITVV